MYIFPQIIPTIFSDMLNPKEWQKLHLAPTQRALFTTTSDIDKLRKQFAIADDTTREATLSCAEKGGCGVGFIYATNERNLNECSDQIHTDTAIHSILLNDPFCSLAHEFNDYLMKEMENSYTQMGWIHNQLYQFFNWFTKGFDACNVNIDFFTDNTGMYNPRYNGYELGAYVREVLRNEGIYFNV